jgi:hypothetical protein
MSSFVFAEILGKSNIPDEKLSIGSYYFFQRLKLFAIFTAPTTPMPVQELNKAIDRAEGLLQ